MLAKKHPFTCCKAPKRSKFRITNIQEIPVDFSYNTAQASTLAIKKFNQLRFLCKNFRFCGIYKSLLKQNNVSCLLIKRTTQTHTKQLTKNVFTLAAKELSLY